jgi:hypothetical protein
VFIVRFCYSVFLVILSSGIRNFGVVCCCINCRNGNSGSGTFICQPYITAVPDKQDGMLRYVRSCSVLVTATPW